MSFDYEKLRREVSWDVARRELGWTENQPINLS